MLCKNLFLLTKCDDAVRMFCRALILFSTLVSDGYVQGTSFMGLQNLIKYYKSRCFDPDIGLPK